MPVPARPLRHVLLAAAVTGAVGVGAASVAPVGKAEATGDLRTQTRPDARALAGRIHRVLHGEATNDRVVAATAGTVVPSGRDAHLTAAGDAVVPQRARSVWDRLADCESGDWRDGTPLPGTARWDYGLTFSHGDIFEGGLNFHPRTWDAFRDPGMPDHAGLADRGAQIAVAERVLAEQGWGAWPVCSRKLGLR